MQNTQIKESTMAKYGNIITHYILPTLGDREIQELDYITICTFRNYLLEKGGKNGQGLSAKTVTDTITLLHAIMRYSEDAGIQNIPPIRRIPVRQARKELRILSRSEQLSLIQQLNQAQDPYQMAILLALYTGMRIGEICALRIEDINYREKTLYVRRTIQRIQNHRQTSSRISTQIQTQTHSQSHEKTHVPIDSPSSDQSPPPPYDRTKILITTPKSPSSLREIPIIPKLEHRMRSFQTAEKGFFLTGSETHYIEPRVLQYQFDRLMKDMDITGMTFHCLRHTFATRCIETGIDIKTLSEILGHSSVSITMNRYVHSSMELKRKGIQRVSELFDVS